MNPLYALFGETKSTHKLSKSRLNNFLVCEIVNCHWNWDRAVFEASVLPTCLLLCVLETTYSSTMGLTIASCTYSICTRIWTCTMQMCIYSLGYQSHSIHIRPPGGLDVWNDLSAQHGSHCGLHQGDQAWHWWVTRKPWLKHHEIPLSSHAEHWG